MRQIPSVAHSLCESPESFSTQTGQVPDQGWAPCAVLVEAPGRCRAEAGFTQVMCALSDMWNLLKLGDESNSAQSGQQKYLCIMVQSFKEGVLKHGWDLKDGREPPVSPWAVNSPIANGPVFLLMMDVKGAFSNSSRYMGWLSLIFPFWVSLRTLALILLLSLNWPWRKNTMSFAKKHPSQPRGFFILGYSDISLQRNSSSSNQGLNGAVERKTIAFCCCWWACDQTKQHTQGIPKQTGGGQELTHYMKFLLL